MDVVEMKQIQRYPLANHLRWLSKGLPGGGVKEYSQLNQNEVNESYANVLKDIKACDTLLAVVKKRI